MPKKRTPTIARLSSAMEGCNAAVEISQADVPMSDKLAPIVSAPSSTDRATQFQEPLMNSRRRKSMDDDLGLAGSGFGSVSGVGWLAGCEVDPWNVFLAPSPVSTSYVFTIPA